MTTLIVRLFSVTNFSNTRNKNISKLAIEEYPPCDKGVDILDYRKCPKKSLYRINSNQLIRYKQREQENNYHFCSTLKHLNPLLITKKCKHFT